ncbi:MAG: hypothetical protein LBI29_00210 [Rickettsiales bacterium]|jgi:DNA polymerase III delta prime subunit|nr:hypothetical protein [Rickettsiales bacterium]
MRKLYGFEKMQENMLNSFKNGKLHHCYMLNGLKGIGKSCFLHNLANVILSARDGGKEPTDLDIERTGRLISGGGHTDLVTLNMITPEEDGSENTSKREEINVGQVRKVILDLKLTQSISKNKLMIVDSIDSVNVNGQNALLKTLEEPSPNTYIFLVCHNLHRVLYTVKSRCILVNIPDPTFENWSLALKEVSAGTSGNNRQELESLYSLSGHSIGLALEIINNKAQNVYGELVNSIAGGDPLEIQKFAEHISSSNLFNLFGIFMDKFFGEILDHHKNGLLTSDRENSSAVAIFLRKNSLEKTIKKYDYSRKMINDLGVYSLDKKHCLTVLLQKMSSNEEP